MNEAKYLIIGGGIAGTTAAETIRQRDREGSIIIVSDEPYRLYSRIMLSKPNFFLEKIPFDAVWLKKESWYADNSIRLLAGKRAMRLDPERKLVSLDDGAELHYEKLLLAIGGCVRTLGVAGAVKKGIYYLRTLDDAKGIIDAAEHTTRAVAIGGGFVSFEMCDMLRLAGKDMTLVIRGPYYWNTILDEPSGRMIENALEKGGVKIFRESEAAEILGANTVEGVILKDGTRLPCEMVVIGIGIVCPYSWIEAAGVKVNRGILANEYLETNIPTIWTAGDVAEFDDVVLGEKIQLGNWVNAQMQGKRAGLNMAGDREPYRMVSFYTTQGFGITLAMVGDVRVTPEKKVITRGSADLNSYVRVIIKDGKVIGATLINKTQEMGLISKLIERNVDISSRTRELADPAFDLKKLIS